MARIDRDSSRCLHRLHRACNSRSALPRAALAPLALAQAWRDLASRKAASSLMRPSHRPTARPWLRGLSSSSRQQRGPGEVDQPPGPGALRRAGSIGGGRRQQVTRLPAPARLQKPAAGNEKPRRSGAKSGLTREECPQEGQVCSTRPAKDREAVRRSSSKRGRTNRRHRRRASRMAIRPGRRT